MATVILSEGFQSSSFEMSSILKCLELTSLVIWICVSLQNRARALC